MRKLSAPSPSTIGKASTMWEHFEPMWSQDKISAGEEKKKMMGPWILYLLDWSMKSFNNETLTRRKCHFTCVPALTTFPLKENAGMELKKNANGQKHSYEGISIRKNRDCGSTKPNLLTQTASGNTYTTLNSPRVYFALSNCRCLLPPAVLFRIPSFSFILVFKRKFILNYVIFASNKNAELREVKKP